MGSDDGRGQRGWVLAAWNDVGGRAGRVVGLVSVGGTDGWVQAASAPDSVLIEYYKVTQKRLFLITLVY